MILFKCATRIPVFAVKLAYYCAQLYFVFLAYRSGEYYKRLKAAGR